ncbi:MAG: transposase [Acidimicrobiales bacterium]
MDWRKRADYVRSRHDVAPAWADEVVNENHAVWLTPDPASRSGRAVRVIGYSASARDILVVILVAADIDEAEQPAGEWWGANAWVASPRERRLYAKED